MLYSEAFQIYMDTGDKTALREYEAEHKDEGGVIVHPLMLQAMIKSGFNREKFVGLLLSPDDSNRELLEAYADWFKME